MQLPGSQQKFGTVVKVEPIDDGARRQRYIAHVRPDGGMRIVGQGLHVVAKTLVADSVDRFGCVYPDCAHTFQTRLAWYNHIMVCSTLLRRDISDGREQVAVSACSTEPLEKTGSQLFRAFRQYTTKYKTSKFLTIIDPAVTKALTVSLRCAERNTLLSERNYDIGGRRRYTGGVCTECHSGFMGRGIAECGETCCWNNVCHRGVQVPLQVFYTKHKGWGVRALVPIYAQQFVCQYLGELLHDVEVETRYKNDLDNADYLLNLDVEEKHGDDNAVVDASRIGNVARFINHSCAPNLDKQMIQTNSVLLEMEHPETHVKRRTPFVRLAFFANRDIHRFEELTWDYGMSAGADSPEGPKLCKCGSSKCRIHFMA